MENRRYQNNKKKKKKSYIGFEREKGMDDMSLKTDASLSCC